MSEQFRAFLSYATEDKRNDPDLFDALTAMLESYVNARLLNARLSIWRDTALRIGEIWNEKIASEVRGSDIFILLLSPRWLESEWCKKEFLLFEQEERARSVAGYIPQYIAPIVIRSIENREAHLTDEQSEIYARISKRQCATVSASEFLAGNDTKRRALIDSIADDIEGMIERRRTLKDHPVDKVRVEHKPSTKKKAYENKAFNYEKVDFVTAAEVFVDPPAVGKSRRVYAQVDFVEQLYVQTDNAQVDFGIRRAFLSIYNSGAGNLARMDGFRSGRSNAGYVRLHEHPNAVSVAMHPNDDRLALAELALPPAVGENYLSVVATASPDVAVENLGAELSVYLEPDSVQLAGPKGRSPPSAQRKKLLTILKVAVKKDEAVRETQKFRRLIKVRQRGD